MEAYQGIVATIALTMGVGWASGINLYAAIFVLGFAGSSGYMELPPGLEVLQDPMVMGAAALMYMVEFFADKTPGVDSGWDSIHTFIRIPAGALLAAGAVGEVSPALEIAAGIVGGSMAGASHLTKASSRLLINTSPEPFSNWGASIGEDLLVLGGIWTMLNHPIIFLCLMVVFIGLAIWALPRMWRVLRAVFRRVGRWLGMTSDDSSEVDSESLAGVTSAQPPPPGEGRDANRVDEAPRLDKP